jgi:uncharacterized membrane protein
MQSQQLDYGNVAGLLLALLSNVLSITGLLAVCFSIVSYVYSLTGTILTGFKFIALGNSITWTTLIENIGWNTSNFFVLLGLLLFGLLCRGVGRYLNSSELVSWMEDITGKKTK